MPQWFSLASAVLASVVIAGVGAAGMPVLGATSSETYAAQARAMLERAVRALDQNASTALAAFNSPTGGFRDGELYVFCFNVETLQITAHTDAWLVGNRIGGQESAGETAKAIVAAAKPGAFTRLTYDYPRPGSTQPVPKVSYVTRVGDEGCGVGYYPSFSDTRAKRE